MVPVTIEEFKVLTNKRMADYRLTKYQAELELKEKYEIINLNINFNKGKQSAN